MKKKLLFTSIAIASLASANAQITITSANMPTVGNTYINRSDTAVTSYGTAGANQTWNFSAWTNDESDTANFVAPGPLNGASNFPSATVGSTADDFSMFMKVSSSLVEVLGFYADFGFGPMAMKFTPAQKFMTLPATYQTAFTGTSAYDITVDPGQLGVDSVRLKSVTYTSSIVDGWGTLTTPAYSNLSTLRQFVTETKTDSTWGLFTGQTMWALLDNSVNTSYTYRWWSNTHSFPVAEVSFGEGDNIYDATYLSSTSVGVNEVAKAKSNVTLFPNPATDKINIAGVSQESLLLIFDQNGKMIEQTTLKKNNNSLNTVNYNNGLYFYNIVPVNGSAVTKGKFVITK